MEDHLADALARVDALSAGAGGGTPPQLPSPLLKHLLLPSAVLGPEFCRLDQAYTTVNPRFLNFESDGDDSVGGGELVSSPSCPSTFGDSGAMPLNPNVSEVPAGPFLHPQDKDALLWGHILLDAETERLRDAVSVTLYPLPPPAPYTVGAPGASLFLFLFFLFNNL
jgi:hypothetical protein